MFHFLHIANQSLDRRTVDSYLTIMLGQLCEAERVVIMGLGQLDEESIDYHL